jgi:hypothetical protein
VVKSIAGYNLLLKKGGTPTAMTAEATTLVSGKTYQITASAKRVISYLHTLTVLDNGVDHTADVLSVDYLSGKITWKAAYTPTGATTITGTYIPLTVIAKARSMNLTMNQGVTDTTDYATAQANGGWRTFAAALRTVSMEIGSIYDAATGWAAVLAARGIVYVEGDLDAADPGKNVFRGFFKVNNQGKNGNQGDVEAETIGLSLWVPDGTLVEQAFAWYIAVSSTLNNAIKIILTAFMAQSSIDVRYLPTGTADGTSGNTGDAVPIELSMRNVIDGINEFSFNFRGSGAPAAV